MARPSITIIRGAGARSRAAAWRSATQFFLRADPELNVPWGAMRTLLADVSKRSDADRVRVLADRVRARLSICLPNLAAGLTEEEQIVRSQHAGGVFARFPFAGPILTDALAEAWAELFANLFEGTEVAFVIADPRFIDPESWEVLPLLLRRLTGAHLVIGDESWDVPEGMIERRVAQIARAQIARLETLRNATVEVREGSPVEAAPLEAISFAPIDSADDLLALQKARGALTDPEDRRQVIAAAYRAFDALAFTAVVELVAPLLAGDAQFPERAELHLLSAIAHHALALAYPRAELDDPLWGIARRQYCEVSPKLGDPADRANVFYHQSLFEARDPSGDADVAISLAQQALDEAGKVDAARRPLIEGYAHNAIAFALLKQQRLPESIAASKEALRIFESSGGHATLPALELEVGRFKVLNNLSRLALARGQREEARRWFALSEQSLDAIPHKRPFFSWFKLRLYLEAMEPAAERIERRLEDALRDWEELSMATYALWAGSLRYMLGHPAKALHHFERLHEVWSVVLVDHVEDLLNARINCAVAAFRADRLDDAMLWLERIRELIPAEDALFEADVLAMCANVEAKRGQSARARELVEKVVALVDCQQEDPEARARMHRSLGDVHLALGEPAEARGHFERSLELAKSPGEANGWRLKPEDVFGAIAGLLECGGDGAVLLPMALNLAPAALEEANAWWDLPRVMEALARGARELRHAEVSALCELAVQRPDCKEAVAAIRAAVEPERISA